MSTDTSRKIEIQAATTRQFVLLAFGGMSFALATLLAFDLIPNMRSDPAAVSTGYFGMAFFGLCAAVAIWRLVAQRGAMVTISPEGLRDVRVAAETIPWRAIRSISTWRMQRQMVLIVAIEPETEQRLTLTRVARWMRNAHRAHGADGFVVSAQGLRIGYPTLFYACRDYWEAWHDHPAAPDHRETPDPVSPKPHPS
jgi:hypothetical protein